MEKKKRTAANKQIVISAVQRFKIECYGNDGVTFLDGVTRDGFSEMTFIL